MICNYYNGCPHLAQCMGRKNHICSTVESMIKYGILDLKATAKNLNITEEMTDHELAQEIVRKVNIASNMIMSIEVRSK